jgi:hypothetical protein
MTDITKCSGETETEVCPLRNKCYRFLAGTGYRQSFFVFTPYDFEKEECQQFWSFDKKE